MQLIARRSTVAARGRQHGFTLMEMLVTTVILAFGLLGMAGLQGLSLRSNNAAYLRTQANLMAYEIVDSMRANRANAVANSYNIAMSASPPSGTSVADADLSAWLTNLARTLPNGDGSVACDGDNVCTVVVQWGEVTGTNITQQFMLSTQI